MYRSAPGASIVAAALCLLSTLSPAAAQERPAAAPATDLDAFMEKVLARREVNRKALNEFVLDETEAFEILGPGRMRLHRTNRNYTWYVRDGMHVRSPVRFNGVTVGAEARDEYESRWIQRETRRQERRAKNEKERGEVAIGPDGIHVSTGGVPAEPRFVSEAYFMEFKFEPGNYYLAGREKLDGVDVLRIEYYPKRLFADDDKKTPDEIKRQSREGRKEQELEDEIERRMNKTALVTLWVDPTLHQIVKYTFDNVWLDFLPGAWLVRIDDLRASMTMGQPFPGIWLPRDMRIHAGVTLANGSFEAGYERTFDQYREADVTTRIRIPKPPEEPEDVEPAHGPNADSSTRSGTSRPAVSEPGFDARPPAVSEPGFDARPPAVSEPGIDASPPAVSEPGFDARPPAVSEPGFDARPPAVSEPGIDASRTAVSEPESQAGRTEVIREIRVHGNAFLPDEEVLKLAAIAVGTPLEGDGLAPIEQRLKDSGRFDSVEVRKRYRSLTDPTDVALVLVVHERPGIRTAEDRDVPALRPWRRFRDGLMFLPILTYADGYGFTYGVRVSAMNTLGIGERLSVPLTWGGTRRAALELERVFDRGPLTRVTSSVGIWQRENPRFEIDDRRVEFKAGVERQFAHVVRLGAEVTAADVTFGDTDDRLWTLGATAAIDTRGDPGFPGNAVYLGAGWNALNVRDREQINRYTLDGRGYLRLFGQPVLAGRAQYYTSDATLPVYERLLLGGSPTLRGFRTGSFDGDTMLVTSAELRVPITSVITGAKLGLTAFADAAKVADHGTPLEDATWRRSAGAGLFLIASILRINLDVAKSLDGGGALAHLGAGFSF